MKKGMLRNSTHLYWCGAAALTALVMSASPVIAQAPAAASADTPDAATVKDGDSSVIIVTGTRTSQRSSIDRKKNAKTATDSIVAEDIGSFPDKNIGEAISRIAGVQLNRDEFGDGTDVQVRGVTAEQTRVEIDGMGQLNTAGGLSAGTGADNARAGDFRELPSDLVQSVDVVKGSLPSNTEGSLGGSIKINTKTGLDFKKPYFSLRYDETVNSIGKKRTPEWNVIASRKFFGNRLGVLANITYSEVQNNSDQQLVSSGYARSFDIDHSPEKTFSYANSPVDPGANVGNLRIFDDKGNLTFASLSPYDIVKRSAAAQSPSDCLASFPELSAAQSGSIKGNGSLKVDPKTGAPVLVPGTTTQDTEKGWSTVWNGNTAEGTSATNPRDAQNEARAEQASCLNQWNEYTPNSLRSSSSENFDRKAAAMLRFDYKVNNNLSLYLSGNIANVSTSSQNNTLNLGNLSDIGQLAEADVDATHHVTRMVLNNPAMSLGSTLTQIRKRSWYMQAGGNYKEGPLKLTFLAGTSFASNEREQFSLSYNYTALGQSETLHVLPNGLWDYDLPTGFDLSDPNNYVGALGNGSGASLAGTGVRTGAPAYAHPVKFTPALSLSYQPSAGNDSETQFKFDATYDFQDKIPFFTDIQWGMQSRNRRGNGWGSGGYEYKTGSGSIGDSPATNGKAQYVAPIEVPVARVGLVIRGCEPTGTGAGFQACNYGYFDNTTTAGGDQQIYINSDVPRGNLWTLTPADMKSLVANSIYQRPTDFLGDYPDKGNVLLRYPYINIRSILNTLPAGNPLNLDCIKTCLSNGGVVLPGGTSVLNGSVTLPSDLSLTDGKRYEQPHSAYQERTTAYYFMLDFEKHLPMDMVFNGNFGTRYVKTEVNATGLLTFIHNQITVTPSATDPNVTTSTTASTTIKINTSIKSKTEDWTPSFNLNLWLVPDKLVARYYSGHVIARPSVGSLLPSGTCQVSESNLDNDDETLIDQRCSGRVGNPGLQPLKAINHTESVEWYMNKDSMFSLSYYYNNVYVGGAIPSTLDVKNSPLFKGTGAVDPVSGSALEDLNFSYASYVNGPGLQRRGVEFATKQAFTYLPWLLKYSGVDFNYSVLSTDDSQTNYDLVTGQTLPPLGQASYFSNVSIWFDNGKLNARLAYQSRGETYTGFAGSNNFPTPFFQANTIQTPYNPGGANYGSETAFVDARINYKITKQVELFAEGRNVTQHFNTMPYQPLRSFADGTKAINSLTYGGARFTMGFIYRH
jgi:outer membrane receptor protein involved in Fe transport